MSFAPQHEDRATPPKGFVSDEQLLALKPLKPRKKATFDSPTPSNYCHICSRTPSRGIRLAVCASLKEGLCRKVICEKCFTYYDFGCTFEQALVPETVFKCTHCQSICPERAQCRTYQNVNKKLRLKRLRQCTEPDEGFIPTKEGRSVSEKNALKSLKDVSRQSRKKMDPGLPLLRALPTSRAFNSNSTSFKKEGTILKTQQKSPNSVAPRLSSLSSDRHSAPKPGQSNFHINGNESYVERGVNPFGNGARAVTVGRPYFETKTMLSQKHAFMSPQSNPREQLLEAMQPTACHVCGKRASHPLVSSFVNCGGTRNPVCQKAFCNVCRDVCPSLPSLLGEEFDEGKGWDCVHCTASCPKDSICHMHTIIPSQQGQEREIGLPLNALASIRHHHSSKASLKSRLLASVPNSY